MATLAPTPVRWRFFLEPLHGRTLVATGLVVWLAGAAYCHGYERLLTGADEWPGSLTWSAIAVLPWFALFEWAKQPQGTEATGRPATLVGLVLGIAALSITLEYVVNFCLGEVTDKLGLLVVRRLPAIAATVLLIALARKAMLQARAEPAAASLASLAGAIDWVSAADNYVELHIGGTVSLRRLTMAEATRALAPFGFVRIHRRYLVNGARIAHVGEKMVRLSDGRELPIGSAFAANLRGI